jgi:hypothetical protein
MNYATIEALKAKAVSNCVERLKRAKPVTDYGITAKRRSVYGL